MKRAYRYFVGKYRVHFFKKEFYLFERGRERVRESRSRREGLRQREKMGHHPRIPRS